MRTAASAFATIIMVAVVLALDGCGWYSSPIQPGSTRMCSTRQTGWTSGGKGAVPGIDEASVTTTTLTIGTTVHRVVIWSDLSGGAPGQTRGTGDSTISAGSHGSADGRRAPFEWKEIDGQVGPVIIAGIPHDLKNGSLFLVSTQQSPFAIVQLRYNLADFPGDRDAMKKLAESDGTIGDFFRNHAGAKPEGTEAGEHAPSTPPPSEARSQP